jgi:hypothetical protein
MYKFISILSAALLFFSAASAQQKRYLYVDSSLLRNEATYEEITTASETIVAAPQENATENDSVYEETVTDTTLYLNGLRLPPDSVKRWRNAKEFAYMAYIDSLLKDAQEKEKNKPKENSGPGFFDLLFASGLMKVLLWTIAGFFIVFIVYRLFLAEGVFRRETKTANKENAETDEPAIDAATDFSALINQALQNNNYRQAVRYQYLRTLHKLAEKNLLQTAPDKTNYQYVRELQNTPFQNNFASLTLNYEYVWYGGFDVGQELYRKIETGFTQFNQKI